MCNPAKAAARLGPKLRRSALPMAGAAVVLLGGCAETPVTGPHGGYASSPVFYYYAPPPLYASRPQLNAPPPVVRARPMAAIAAPRPAVRHAAEPQTYDGLPALPSPAGTAADDACVGWWRICHFFP